MAGVGRHRVCIGHELILEWVRLQQESESDGRRWITSAKLSVWCPRPARSVGKPRAFARWIMKRMTTGRIDDIRSTHRAKLAVIDELSTSHEICNRAIYELYKSPLP